jgi:hypothetical protein
MMDATAFANEPTGFFCPATPTWNHPSTAWYIDFNGGNVYPYPNANTCYVRCVACSVPPTTGLLAAWSATTGTYADSTSQARRYNVSNAIVTDTLTDIQWQQNASATAMNWGDAATYCANQTTGGLNGWRVPNLAELMSLVDFTNSTSPYMNGGAFPNAPVADIWSSTPDIGNAGYSWDVQFHNCAYPGYVNQNTLDRVRCVRSCYPIPSTNRYTVNSGTVTDTVTGLIWQQTASTSVMNQTDAIKYSAMLSLPGINSVWRLPTVKELLTLADYSIPTGSLRMNSVFVGVAGNGYWPSTLIAGTSSAYLYITSSGGLNLVSPSVSNHARCVACSVPPVTGLLALWNQAGGTYADSTNQPGRYSVSNGIVTDTLTGLQWQQNASATAMNWGDAATYCANQTTGGLSGWRVPNIGELGTLVDYTINAAPHVNTNAFLSAPVANLWSITSDLGNTGNSWSIFLADYGYSASETIASLNRIRCVRSCYQGSVANRYMIASGTVTDIVVGLIWQQTSVGNTMNQSNAIIYCSELNLANFSWRLRTVKELSTLVDYSLNYGSLMMSLVAFPGEPASYFWSSTAQAGNFANAWYVDFNYGEIGVYAAALNHFVRCVR